MNVVLSGQTFMLEACFEGVPVSRLMADENPAHTPI